MKKCISQNNLKSVYLENNTAIKVFSKDYNKSDVLYEALNTARVEDAGVNIFSPVKKTFKKLGREISKDLTSEQTLSLLNTNGNIWVGLFKNGLDVISSKTYNIQHYSGNQLKLNESSIYALCEDKYGNIWLGNGWGVYKGNKETMELVNVKVFGLCYIYDIIEDSNGNIWVATMGNGVYKYNQESQKIEHYTNQINVKSYAKIAQRR